PIIALTRELKEELDILVAKADLWFEYLHHYPDKTALLKLWLVKEFFGEPEAKEGQQLRWVNFKEMLNLKLLEGNLPILERIKELFEENRDHCSVHIEN